VAAVSAIGILSVSVGHCGDVCVVWQHYGRRCQFRSGHELQTVGLGQREEGCYLGRARPEGSIVARVGIMLAA
jgi:hypothetical protein